MGVRTGWQGIENFCLESSAESSNITLNSGIPVKTASIQTSDFVQTQNEANNTNTRKEDRAAFLWLGGRSMPIEDRLFLSLNKINFLTISLGTRQTYTSHIIHISEIFMLNVIYRYYEVSGEINSLYLFHTILLLLLCFYLVSIIKQKSNIFPELD
jgi:hypothetical protein